MEEIRENKMGNTPMLRLIISMSLPAIFSMLVQSLYNIVDSYFVSKISMDALTAVSLAFPIQQLMIAMAVATGRSWLSLPLCSLPSSACLVPGGFWAFSPRTPM